MPAADDLIVDSLYSHKTDPEAWRVIQKWNNDHKPHVEEW